VSVVFEMVRENVPADGPASLDARPAYVDSLTRGTYTDDHGQH